jgi:hypothetical protein
LVKNQIALQEVVAHGHKLRKFRVQKDLLWHSIILLRIIS